MDDETIRRQLTSVDGPMRPPDAFAAALKEELLAELGLTDAPGTPRSSRHTRHGASRSLPSWWMAAAALIVLALAIAVLGAGALVRWLNGPALNETLPGQPTILRVAVRPDAPQALVPGGGAGGWDIDVAEEIGRRLGMTVQLVITSPANMLDDHSAWDVALPSTWLSSSTIDDLGVTVPYYAWPAFVLAGTGSAGQVSDLAGQSICVVPGSSGEAWVAGRATGTLGEVSVQPPAGVEIQLGADDQACLDKLRAGTVTAIVTQAKTAGDVAAIAGASMVGTGPVLVERRPMLVSGTGDDADTLRDAIDQAITSARLDGTLTELAVRRFGGEDLSAVP